VPSGVLIDIELKEKIATREDETIFSVFARKEHSEDVWAGLSRANCVCVCLSVCGFSSDLQNKRKNQH
jgi:hypothetical protein